MNDSSNKSAPPRKPPKVKCPQCGSMSLFSPDNAYRPFCSERCKLIDLGAWANDEYRIAGSPLEMPATESDGDAGSATMPRTLQ